MHRPLTQGSGSPKTPDRSGGEWFTRLVATRYATDHHELRLRPNALEIMPQLARHYGEPFGDSSAVPSFHVLVISDGSFAPKIDRKRQRHFGDVPMDVKSVFG